MGSSRTVPPSGGRPSDPENDVENGAKAAPKLPSGLGKAGRAAWRAILAEAPLLVPTIDVLGIERYARLVDERVATAAELARGPLLAEPIVTPRGDVVGERWVANPAASMLRAIDRELDTLGIQLALSPAARGKLGLTLTAAEQTALDAAVIVSKMLRADYR